ncbi:MAG: sensor histidine kinase [Spirochaetota bacterium]
MLLVVESALFYPDFMRIQTRPMIIVVAGVVAAVVAASGLFSAPRPLAIGAVGAALLASVQLLQPVFEHQVLGWLVPTALSGAVLVMLGLFFRVHALQQAALEAHRQRAELGAKLAMASAELLDSRHRESLSLIASGIAHEVNNPMTYVQGNLDLLREELADAFRGESGRTRSVVDELMESMATGLTAITEVVARIRSVFKGSESPPQEVLVYEATRAAIAALPADRRRLVGIENAVPPDFVASAHPADLYIVIANLLRNAVDACGTTDTGHVTVSTARRDGAIDIAVADNGEGMTPEEVERCTDPFYTTRHDRGGMGVGLALCGAIAERTGATLTISSVPGTGTTVCYTLRDPVRRGTR